MRKRQLGWVPTANLTFKEADALSRKMQHTFGKRDQFEIRNIRRKRKGDPQLGYLW